MVNTCTRVSLRQRAIKNDRISLYLDFYPPVRNPETMQMSRREYLGIYIYAHPKNEMEREFNTDMLNKAEAIRCIRTQSLINEEFGFLDKTRQKASKGVFITTSSYSLEARKYAEEKASKKIVLIDGQELARYMIEYNVGVSLKRIYEVKRIDSDYFEDDNNE